MTGRISRTLLVPYSEANVYGGSPCEPIAKACETWKSGAILKALVKSARSPVNM